MIRNFEFFTAWGRLNIIAAKKMSAEINIIQIKKAAFFDAAFLEFLFFDYFIKIIFLVCVNEPESNL